MKRKAAVIAGIVAAAGIAAFIGVRLVSGAGAQVKQASATPLAKMDLTNTVSVTGTVKSIKDTKVYTTLNYPVKSVNVEVGDTVSAGQVLCELDTEDLLEKISEQTALLNNSQAQVQHSVAVAKQNYETEKFNQEQNYDAALFNAQNAVTSAERGVETAELHRRKVAAELGSARRALKDYTDSTGSTSSVYDATHDSLRKAVTTWQLEEENAKNAIADAKKAVDDAKASLAMVQIQKQQALINARDNVTSATLGANMDDKWMQLENLKKDLEAAVVKAPVPGTVTSVLASEGASGAGLLFVIEDTSGLKVDTKIQEYDIDLVEVGQAARIKSDGVGDDEYEGKVEKIAPTAVKSLNGETLETTDVQFATEIAVTSKPTRLKIGMNARIEIITQEKKDVFAAPYDAVLENTAGDYVVYVAVPGQSTDSAGGKKKNPEATFTVKEVAVTTGMETDFYIEIISDGLAEGDLIIANPVGISAGDTVALESFAGAEVVQGAADSDLDVGGGVPEGTR